MKPIRIQELNKSFKNVQALNNVSFEVSEGELFGFIGPDGAGKSTLFRIITTLLKPDSGTAEVLGRDVVSDYMEIRPKLGYMPGRFSLYQDLSVRENLEFFASVFNSSIEQNYDLIRPVYNQLEPFANRLAGDLSGGMKQKLALSCALIHQPEMLVLDEPTTGVDAVSRQDFWDMLKYLKSKGITILVSTPYMDEAEQCDRVALIQDGSVMKIDTPENIIKQFKEPILAVKTDDKYRALQVLRSIPTCSSAHPFGESIHYIDKRERPAPGEFEKLLQEKGFVRAEVQFTEAGIEDVFMSLMREDENE